METKKLEGIIPSVNYHLWNPCNMRCKFCFATFQDAKVVLPKGHLAKEESLELIREIAAIGFKKITFAGGEPTLCPWISELVKEAKKQGLTTMLVTNGTKLNEDFLSANQGYLDWIILSVDSLDDNANLVSGRAIAGKRTLSVKDYKNTIDNINKYNYRLKINTVVHQFNYKESMLDFIEYAKPERWKVFQVLPMKGENDELISPDSFLPVAHEFGLSSSIDMWVIEHTLQFMAENRAKMPAHRFAINLSPTSVCQARFPVEVSQLLAKYQIEAWQLIFEVTESNALTNVKQAQITLQHLQELGCQIAIDDFGTGYASYARLKNVNADLLKIDGSFIRNIVSNSLDYQIVASICHLARMKKMLVVAEYVENEEIREAVLSLGIDYMQGYLIGKPQPLIDTLNEIEPIRESA